MAVELRRFIEEQLSRLSPSHPDRVFLDGLLRAIEGYIARVDGGTAKLESFLEGKVRRTVVIGGETVEQLERKLYQAGINISGHTRDILYGRDFTTLESQREVDLVIAEARDLAQCETPTFDQILTGARKLGLEPCPAETGLRLRLAYRDQPQGEALLIGMKPIADRRGNPRVFSLGHDGGGLWLDDYWADPDCRWRPEYRFVFSLRKYYLFPL